MTLNVAIENLQNHKELTQYFKKIPSKNQKTKKAFLESIVLMAYIFYTINNEDFLIIVDELSKIDFVDSYDYWDWIDSAISLLAYNSLVHNQHEKFSQLKTILDNAINQGKNDLIKQVKKNVHNRFLTGETLDKTTILKLAEDKNTTEEINQRLLFLMTLLKLKVYHQESSVDDNFLNNEIMESTSIISEFIRENGFSKVFPFV